MRLEERLEERAGRAASGDPRAVLEAARARADVAGGGRPRRRALVAVAAIVTLFALGAAGLGVLRGEDRALTATAPDDAIPSAAPDEAITSDVPTVEGGWRLVATVRGEARQPVGGGVPITITISGDDVTGSDGCNGLETWLEDGTVSEPGIRTLIGCGDPEVVDLFWRVLDQTPAYELRDDELWLDAAGGDSLVFARSEGRGGTGAGELSAPDEPSVSDAEAQQVFSEMVAIAAERTPAAMDRLCRLSQDDCNGISGGVRSGPHGPLSAPGPDESPIVLCSRDVGRGARLLVVEGDDGFGRPYVSQMVFVRADGEVVAAREAAFWLGVLHAGAKYAGSVAWTTMHHAQPDAAPGRDVQELLTRGRAPCASP